jgi:hypothetical protein
MWQAIKSFYYIHVNMSVVWFLVGAGVVYTMIPFGEFVGFALMFGAVVYWFDSGRYSR